MAPFQESLEESRIRSPGKLETDYSQPIDSTAEIFQLNGSPSEKKKSGQTVINRVVNVLSTLISSGIVKYGFGVHTNEAPMTKRKSIIVAVGALLSLTVASLGNLSSQAVTSPETANTPITAEELRAQARVELNNAASAGRLSKEEETKFSTALDSASSLSDVERTWAELETAAQQAKVKHDSIDNLQDTFTRFVTKQEKAGIVSAEAMTIYRDRLKSITRLKKQFRADDNFYDFWEYVVLSLDLSSLEERLSRALSRQYPQLEGLNELILRTDFYLLRNEVAARGLTVYKSFEVEPADLLDARNRFVRILQDKATSNLKTPKVREMLYTRLISLQYEPYHQFPNEVDIDKAIVEVERLLDSGARNGNLSAEDDIRVRHELDLIKEIKKAYPGVKPGIDPVEKELRLEEIRYMSMDLRCLQDWLGRALRKDGDNSESREQLSRLMHRIVLSYYSHRITKHDVDRLLAAIDVDLRTISDEAVLGAKYKELQGQMDMMVADWSLSPAQITPRVNDVNRMLASVHRDQSTVTRERDRIQQYLNGFDQLPAPQKYGVSIVAATELEMLRKKVDELIRQQGAS